MLPIIQYRRLYYTISGTLFALSIIGLLLFGLRLGIDFTGGTMMEIAFSKGAPDNSALTDTLKPFDLGGTTIQSLGDNSRVLRFKPIDEKQREKVFQAVVSAFDPDKKGIVTLSRAESIGPVLGVELKQKTIQALVIAIIVIALYITWAFRKVSQPVKSWKYGVCTIAALFHDVVIPVGLFAYLGHFANIELDASIVAALLTVLGFSVHDTIVVFDRIRENLHVYKEDFATVVNRSVNQTIARSINTSFTALLALLAVYFFGGTSTQTFVLTMIVGITVGTYSSIFIASPLLVTWYQSTNKKGRT